MSIVENRYAEALLRTAIEADLISEFTEQLLELRCLVGSEDLKEVLEHPKINCSAKKNIIKEILKEKFNEYIINFYLILLDSGRYKLLPEIFDAYKKMSDEYRKISNVKIISANELNESEIKSIIESIKRRFDLPTIKAEATIDPSLIGGITVKIGDIIIDGTINGKLERLKNSIINESICAK